MRGGICNNHCEGRHIYHSQLSPRILVNCCNGRQCRWLREARQRAEEHHHKLLCVRTVHYGQPGLIGAVENSQVSQHGTGRNGRQQEIQ